MSITGLKKHLSTQIEGYSKTFLKGSKNERLFKQWLQDVERLEPELEAAKEVDMTTAELKKIEDLAGRATPGPYKYDSCGDVYYCSPRDAITKFSSRYPNQLSLGLQQRQPPQTANTPPTPSLPPLSPALPANRVVFRKGDSLECIDDTGVVGVLSVGSVYVADRDQYDFGGRQCIEVVVPKGKVYCLARQFVLSGAASPKAYGFQGASTYVKLAPAPINAPINFTIKIGTDEKPTDAREASRCECGAHSVGSRNHSSWCLLYNKER